MNAKKAKALRRAAREIVKRQGISKQDQHLIHVKTGVIHVGQCERGVLRALKKQVAAGKIVFKRPQGAV